MTKPFKFPPRTRDNYQGFDTYEDEWKLDTDKKRFEAERLKSIKRQMDRKKR